MCRPYSVLHPVGFAVPRRCQPRGALLPHPFALTGPKTRRYAFCGTFPDPGRRRGRRALPGTVVPWSPDFPRLDRSRAAAARSSDARAIWSIAGRGSKSASSLARHSPSMMPSMRVGAEAALEGDHRLRRVADVIAEPLEREQEAGVGPERVDQVAGRAGQRQPAAGQRVPREQFARILLARRGDVGMADDIAAADAVPLLDVGDQRDQRRDLLVGERAIAEFVAGIDDLDPDAGRIDVGDPAPVALAGVPGALVLVDQAEDRAILVDADNGPRPWPRARSAGRSRPRRRACRYNGARSSTPAAPARRNWAKGDRSSPSATWRMAAGVPSSALQAARERSRRSAVVAASVSRYRPRVSRSAAKRVVWPITVSPAPSISAPSGASAEASRSNASCALLGAEIEQDVAAQDDVELAGMRRRLEHVVDLEADLPAQRLGRAPAIVAFLEPADHLGDAEPALDLELGVGAVARAVDHRAATRRCRGCRSSSPATCAALRRTASRANRLPARSSSPPTRCGAACLSPRNLASAGSELGRQQVERLAVAEEIGFVVEQRLDDLVGERRLAAHDEDGDQFVERRDAALAEQRRQRRLDPPAPAHGQLLAGARFEQAGEDPAGAVAYLHEPSPTRRRSGARSCTGGRMAQARPASATARGIPQTARAGLVLGQHRSAGADQRRRALAARRGPCREDHAQRAPARARRRPKPASDRPTAGSRWPTRWRISRATRLPLPTVDAQDGHRPARSRSGRAAGAGRPRRQASRGRRQLRQLAGEDRHEGSGRCWVTRIGTPILAGSAWKKLASAWMPPVEAPIASSRTGPSFIARIAPTDGGSASGPRGGSRSCRRGRARGACRAALRRSGR